MGCLSPASCFVLNKCLILSSFFLCSVWVCFWKERFAVLHLHRLRLRSTRIRTSPSRHCCQFCPLFLGNKSREQSQSCARAGKTSARDRNRDPRLDDCCLDRWTTQPRTAPLDPGFEVGKHGKGTATVMDYIHRLGYRQIDLENRDIWERSCEALRPLRGEVAGSKCSGWATALRAAIEAECASYHRGRSLFVRVRSTGGWRW